MRFSILHHPGSPRVGGAYTYVDSIVRVLAENVRYTRHSLILLARDAVIPKELHRPSVEVLNLHAFPDVVVAMLLAAFLRRWRWHPFLGLQRTADYYMNY